MGGRSELTDLLLGEEVAAEVLEGDHLLLHPLQPAHQLRRVRLDRRDGRVRRKRLAREDGGGKIGVEDY